MEFAIYYGIKVTLNSSETSIVPYFKPSLEGTASTSLFVVKGGLTLRGTIANTELKFAINYVNQTNSVTKKSFYMSGSIRPFEWNLNAFY